MNSLNRPGFYIEFDENDPRNQVIKFGYSEGRVISKRGLLASSAEWENKYPRTHKLMPLLATMFREGISLPKAPLNEDYNIDAAIRKSSRLGEYEKIEFIDILVFSGAIEYDFEQHFSSLLNPAPPPRPAAKKAIQEYEINEDALFLYIYKLGFKWLISRAFYEGAIRKNHFLHLWRQKFTDGKEKREEFRRLKREMRTGNRNPDEKLAEELLEEEIILPRQTRR